MKGVGLKTSLTCVQKSEQKEDIGQGVVKEYFPPRRTV